MRTTKIGITTLVRLFIASCRLIYNLRYNKNEYFTDI